MKTYIPLDRLKRSRDSGSALYNMHPTDVLGRAGGGVFVFDSIGWIIIGLLKSVFLPRNLWVCEGELHGVYIVVEDGAFHSAVGGYELLVDVSENHLHLCH